MKTAVSVPDDVFEAAERLAERLGWSRSQLYSRAIAAYVANESDEDPVTAALDRLADEHDTGAPHNAGKALVEAGRWEW